MAFIIEELWHFPHFARLGNPAPASTAQQHRNSGGGSAAHTGKSAEAAVEVEVNPGVTPARSRRLRPGFGAFPPSPGLEAS